MEMEIERERDIVRIIRKHYLFHLFVSFRFTVLQLSLIILVSGKFLKDRKRIGKSPGRYFYINMDEREIGIENASLFND